MADTVFPGFIKRLMNGTCDLDAAGTVVRVMLERSTSAYVVDASDEFVSDLTGFVEVTAASYTRKTVSNKAVAQDNANVRVEWDFDDVTFGNLEAGQVVSAVWLYVQTGGSDASPSDDYLICRLDSLSGLPATLDGSEVVITWNSEGVLWGLQGS